MTTCGVLKVTKETMIAMKRKSERNLYKLIGSIVICGATVTIPFDCDIDDTTVST